MMIPTVTLDDVELGPRPAIGLRRENHGITSQRWYAITSRRPARMGWSIDRAPDGTPLRMRPYEEQVCV